MKLKNKQTGEIINNNGINFAEGNYKTYNSLAELNEEWEDYEEPKEYWYIMGKGVIRSIEDENTDFDNKHKEIGNYFSSREEAEKAVEKLKAWKRLKDKGFRFIKDWVYKYDMPKVENHTYIEFVAICEDGALFNDLDICFGGEE